MTPVEYCSSILYLHLNYMHVSLRPLEPSKALLEGCGLGGAGNHHDQRNISIEGILANIP